MAVRLTRQLYRTLIEGRVRWRMAILVLLGLLTGCGTPSTTGQAPQPTLNLTPLPTVTRPELDAAIERTSALQQVHAELTLTGTFTETSGEVREDSMGTNTIRIDYERYHIQDTISLESIIEYIFVDGVRYTYGFPYSEAGATDQWYIVPADETPPKTGQEVWAQYVDSLLPSDIYYTRIDAGQQQIFKGMRCRTYIGDTPFSGSGEPDPFEQSHMIVITLLLCEDGYVHHFRNTRVQSGGTYSNPEMAETFTLELIEINQPQEISAPPDAVPVEQ